MTLASLWMLINHPMRVKRFFKSFNANYQKLRRFEALKNEAPGLLGSKRIKWNFTKFLINAEGKVLKRYAPTIKTSSIDSDIAELLEKNSE